MKNTLTVICLILSGLSWSQVNHRLFLEAGGNAGFGSLNYEKHLIKLDRDKSEFVFRTGLSWFPGDQNVGDTFVFPNAISFLYGSAHKLELGFGQTISIRLKGAAFVRTVFNIGYRYQTDKPLFFRLTYTPLMSNIWDIQFQHWGGVSIGYQFTKK